MTDLERWAIELADYIARHPVAIDLRWRIAGLTGATLEGDELDRLTLMVESRLNKIDA